MPGDSSLRARWSSMLEAASAHSPWCLPTITHTFASLFKTANQSYKMRSEERRVGKECRSRCDWSSDVCSSDLEGSVTLRGFYIMISLLKHQTDRVCLGTAP